MTNSNRVTQLADYRFSSPEIPILTVSVRGHEIAKRVGLTEETWEEDGLGPARGAIIRLPSGTVVLMRELDHAIERMGEKGPHFEAGVSDVVAVGLEALVSEILHSLALTRDAIAWMAEKGTAEDFLARWTAWKLQQP